MPAAAQVDTGTILGTIVGAWMGKGLTNLYLAFYRFPVLEFRFDAWVVVSALGISLIAGVVGTYAAVRQAVRLPPAEAMRPAAPAEFKPTIMERLGLHWLFSQTARIIVRNLERKYSAKVLKGPKEVEIEGRKVLVFTLIDDKNVTIVQGANPNSGLLPVNFYFDDATGLLMRVVRWNETPVGPNPTQMDYEDYRDVAGIKMPHTWTVSLTYMQMTIKLDALQANVPVDAARFAMPAPSTGPRFAPAAQR